MSNTYYNSLSGMMAASYGLQNTSNNVANMQSPGFKRTDVFYSSLGNSNSEGGLGCGVTIGGNATNFSSGKYLPTESPSDLAIIGQGFFVIKLKGGEFLYTRDGEFAFNDEGILMDQHSGGEVQGYDKAGNFVSIHEQGPKISAGKASHILYLKGSFSPKEKTSTDPIPIKNKYENISINLQVFDKAGKAHTVTCEFESVPDVMGKDEGLNWNLLRVDCSDAEITTLGEQQIQFSNMDSTASSDYSQIRFTLNGDQGVLVHFGSYGDGSDESVTYCSDKKSSGMNNMPLEVWKNDGYGEGKQISYSFDENGQIAYLYDNGQSLKGIHVGLARFDDLNHALTPASNNLFRAKSNASIHFGRANQDGMGSIKAQNLESSNVDSTTEFANIVILQRMFQACSQIMDIDKQLVEGLVQR